MSQTKKTYKSYKDYKFIKLLGRGSYGETYLTQKGEDPKFLATKILNKAKVDNNPINKKCFDREIQLLKEMDDPNIIKFYHMSVNENYYFIFMEYCNGGNLQEILEKYQAKYKKESFSLDIVQHIMKQLISGIKYMHSNNIVHRDIKLENILLSFDNENDLKNLNIKKSQLKIIDFGVSTKLNKNGEASTIIGTPLTMDPLILKGKVNAEKISEYDERVDIWSLGVVFYQLLTGKRLFYVHSLAELISKVEEGSYTLPIKMLYYKETASFINVMLQYEVKNRYTITELAQQSFITKEIKDFNKITRDDINQIIYLIDEKGLHINTKENDAIYRVFNSGSGAFNKLGNPQVIRDDKRNTTEDETKFVYSGNIYGKNYDEKINYIMEILKQEGKNKLMHRNTDGDVPYNSNINLSNLNIEDIKQNSSYNKNNINNNNNKNINDNEIKKYLNGLLNEYNAIKEYFNKNGLIIQEEDAKNKIIQIQNNIQNYIKTNTLNSINIETLPKPISPEYLYNCPIEKRNSIFLLVLDKYKNEKKQSQIFVTKSQIKLEKMNKSFYELVKKTEENKLNNEKAKLIKLKKIVDGFELNYKNIWVPAPQIEEDLQLSEDEIISYEGCEFKMIIKTTNINYNSAAKLNLRFNMKINEQKNFSWEINVSNYGNFEEQVLWYLTDKDWENLSQYFIKVDFIYNKVFNQSINLDISKLKDDLEINSKHLIKFPFNNGDTTFNFNIKLIMPEGKTKLIKEVKKIIKVKKIYPAFEGKSPDTQNIPSVFIPKK